MLDTLRDIQAATLQWCSPSTFKSEQGRSSFPSHFLSTVLYCEFLNIRFCCWVFMTFYCSFSAITSIYYFYHCFKVRREENKCGIPCRPVAIITGPSEVSRACAFNLSAEESYDVSWICFHIFLCIVWMPWTVDPTLRGLRIAISFELCSSCSVWTNLSVCGHLFQKICCAPWVVWSWCPDSLD